MTIVEVVLRRIGGVCPDRCRNPQGYAELVAELERELADMRAAVGRIGQYLLHDQLAAALRAQGQEQAATNADRECDRLYEQLPDWARWSGRERRVAPPEPKPIRVPEPWSDGIEID